MGLTSHPVNAFDHPMAYPFERTLRSLNGYESGTRVLLVVLVVLVALGLGASSPGPWALGSP